MAIGQWLPLLALAVRVTSATNYKYEAQDPILDKEYYAPACPDYKQYSMHGQSVDILGLIT